MKRCGWANPENPIYLAYHDEEWGRPISDDRELFELLILEGAQAGLSWETVLNKRESYRKAFHKFDAKKVARMTKADEKRLLQNPGIIRNRLKISSTVTNAQAFLQVQKEFGSFARYLWAFVENKPIQTQLRNQGDIRASTEISDKLSKDLKKRGFRFVGTTICYAYMQATGMVNDHILGCSCHAKVAKLKPRL